MNWPGLTLLIALLVLYGPVYWDLLHGLWRTEEQAHAPIIALVSAWLIWRSRQAWHLPGKPAPLAGGLALTLGLAVYTLGRALEVPLLEVGSQLPVLAGLLLLTGGTPRLRAFRFPIVFLVFMLPLPGMVLEALTGPLKEWVSMMAEELLYLAGYPIARTGVVLSLSQYRLLVDDACSGLYSMISLSALGLLFMHLAARSSRLHNGLLLAAILPIAFAANLVRVLALLLITYHFGDAIGQGPFHEMTGLLTFSVALMLLFTLDVLLARWLPADRSVRRGTTTPEPDKGRHALRPAWIALPMLAAAGLSIALHPEQRMADERGALDLEAIIPKQFDDWRVDGRFTPITVQGADAGPYGQTLARGYVNSRGQHVMLAIAYGDNQLHDRLQVHRPEYCYRAQGFTVAHLGDTLLSTPGGALPVRQLVARRQDRVEPISYWITLGDEALLPGASRKLAQLRHGLSGRIPDGMLIRVSSLDGDLQAGLVLQDGFIRQLLAATDSRRLGMRPPR